MDGLSLLKQLGSGAKFNFKRFREDAEIIKLLPSKPEAKDVVSGSPHQEFPKRTKHGISRKKKPDVEDSEQVEEMEEDVEAETELHILGSMKVKDSSVCDVRKKRKRKKKSSEERALQIRQEEVRHARREDKIFVYGSDVPDPVQSFQELQSRYGFHQQILDNISESGYSVPTAVQKQAIPAMCEGRELLVCAPTGSGKTAAFLLPILYCLNEPCRQGFRALIVAPTRELMQQIYQECVRLAEGRGFRVHYLENAATAAKKFGHSSGQKCDILMTTPNRLVHLLQQEPPGIRLGSVQWLVVDESDKLFEEGKTGFRDQLGVIYKACDHPKVRRAMFSATFAHQVEEWCRLNLDSVLQVYVGARNSAAASVDQKLLFVGTESGKLLAVRDLLHKGVQPPVLVFVQSKERAKELHQELSYDGVNVDVIHADRPQAQREKVLKGFRGGSVWILICTELMGRGIDFKGVRLVINYDFPTSSVSYIHRIGRTGRAGRTGQAVTYFTENDITNLRSIATVMREAGCEVPQYMLHLQQPKRKLKRKLARSAPERKSIRTIPQSEIETARLRSLLLHKFVGALLMGFQIPMQGHQFRRKLVSKIIR